MRKWGTEEICKLSKVTLLVNSAELSVDPPWPQDAVSIIFLPLSSVLFRLQPSLIMYLMTSLTIGNDFPFLHLFLSNPARHCGTSSCFWSSPSQQDSPLSSEASLCPSQVILSQEKNTLPKGPPGRTIYPFLGFPDWEFSTNLPSSELHTLPGRSRCSGNVYWIEHTHIKYRAGNKWLSSSIICQDNCKVSVANLEESSLGKERLSPIQYIWGGADPDASSQLWPYIR